MSKPDLSALVQTLPAIATGEVSKNSGASVPIKPESRSLPGETPLPSAGWLDSTLRTQLGNYLSGRAPAQRGCDALISEQKRLCLAASPSARGSAQCKPLRPAKFRVGTADALTVHRSHLLAASTIPAILPLRTGGRARCSDRSWDPPRRPGGPKVLKSWDRPGKQASVLKRSVGRSVWGWLGECR